MDAEGFHDEVPCPECGSVNTVTYRYVEGFSELECPTCGYRSDADELSDLTRYQGVVLERDEPWLDPRSPDSWSDDGSEPRSSRDDALPVPIRALKA